jgi:glycosyltransferase involved in cell wall biosynthesis
MKNGRRLRRIVHVTRGLDVGGQEKLLVELARLANRRCFELHFVSLSTRGKLAGAINAQGWAVTALDEPDGLRPGLVWRLTRCLRLLDPDIVHTHDDRPLLYGAPAARLAGVPGLIHTKHYGRLAQVTPRRAALMRLVARLCQRFVCVSRASARLALADGVEPSKITTIWNGIDLARFAFSGPDPRGPALIVARLSPEKDIRTLLRATALVVRQEPSFRLDIAGAGPEQPFLERLAAELQLQQYVRFLGEVRDVPELLARARFFVLSSTTEGISLTLLEAMARGLAVVATRVGGNPEVVAEGETGLLVPAQDAGELARAMLLLWRDVEAQQCFAHRARQRVEQYFDVGRMVDAYQSLYEELSDKNVRPTGKIRLESKACAS